MVPGFGGFGSRSLSLLILDVTRLNTMVTGVCGRRGSSSERQEAEREIDDVPNRISLGPTLSDLWPPTGSNPLQFPEPLKWYHQRGKHSVPEPVGTFHVQIPGFPSLQPLLLYSVFASGL